MMVWIVGQQPFGLGDGEQAIIGTDERQRSLSTVEQILVQQAGRRQLYSIVST